MLRPDGAAQQAMPLNPETPLSELPLLFLDLETTGLEPAAGHRVAEVALLRTEGARELGRIDSLVNPGRPCDPEAAAVNGLRDEDLAAAPPFAALAPAVQALADGAVLVGHHVRFDLTFLALELRALGLPPLAGPSLDTLALARRLLRRSSYSLASLCAAFELPAPTHRAMADVEATRALFWALLPLMDAAGVRTLGDALRLERGLPPGAPEPQPPILIAQALAEGRALRIVYRSRTSPDPTTRVIHPIYLSVEASGLYLKAFCELRQDVRAFAVAKIELMELA
jgi:DNA polymerase III subunit epsilon